jgi:hypothetical protein
MQGRNKSSLNSRSEVEKESNSSKRSQEDVNDCWKSGQRVVEHVNTLSMSAVTMCFQEVHRAVRETSKSSEKLWTVTQPFKEQS